MFNYVLTLLIKKKRKETNFITFTLVNIKRKISFIVIFLLISNHKISIHYHFVLLNMKSKEDFCYHENKKQDFNMLLNEIPKIFLYCFIKRNKKIVFRFFLYYLLP